MNWQLSPLITIRATLKVGDLLLDVLLAIWHVTTMQGYTLQTESTDSSWCHLPFIHFSDMLEIGCNACENFSRWSIKVCKRCLT